MKSPYSYFKKDWFRKKTQKVVENEEIELRIDPMYQETVHPENYVTGAFIYRFDCIVKVLYDGKNTHVCLTDGTKISYNNDTDMMNYKDIMKKMKTAGMEFLASYDCENRTLSNQEITTILLSEEDVYNGN